MDWSCQRTDHYKSVLNSKRWTQEAEPLSNTPLLSWQLCLRHWYMWRSPSCGFGLGHGFSYLYGHCLSILNNTAVHQKWWYPWGSLILAKTLGLQDGCLIAYSLYIDGQRHIISMKSKRNLVSKHLSVFTYTDQGALLEDQPFVQNDCYYQGFIDADPEFMVAVTTCFGGLLGSLQINGTAYEIKPKNFSSTFEHLIYKMYSRETESFPRGCGITGEETAWQLIVQDDPFTLRQSNSPGWWTNRLTVEFTIVIDDHRFIYRDSNVSQVHEDVITVLNVINVHSSPLEVVIVLMALETWNKENLIDVETKLAPLLRRFCTWKKQNLDHRVRQDVGHLFVNYPYGISTGMAYVGGVCHSGFNCGIGSFRGLSETSFARQCHISWAIIWVCSTMKVNIHVHVVENPV